MPHVNQLVDEFGKKGFVVVGVTSEAEAPTQKYIDSTGMKGYVAFEPKGGGSMREFGFRGYPSAALVNPKGKVVWKGHPGRINAKIIAKHIKGARVGGGGGSFSLDVELPRKFSSIGKKMKKGDLGRSLKDIDKAVGKSANDAAALEALEASKKLIIDLHGVRSTTAATAETQKRCFDALTEWKQIGRAFKGHKLGKEADAKVKAIRSDKGLRNEILAGERISKALKLSRSGNSKKAISVLTSIVSGPLKGTVEAERAANMIAELQKPTEE